MSKRPIKKKIGNLLRPSRAKKNEDDTERETKEKTTFMRSLIPGRHGKDKG